MRLIRVFILLISLLIAPWQVIAQTDSDFDSLVDFGDLTDITGGKEPTVEISLGGALLRFVGNATREEDSDLAETLSSLRSIEIRVFDIAEGRFDRAKDQVNMIADRLTANQWEPTIKVNSEDTIVRMFMKMDGEQVTGMTVMILEDRSEAVFINIVGAIDPDQLGRVADKFGVSID